MSGELPLIYIYIRLVTVSSILTGPRIPTRRSSISWVASSTSLTSLTECILITRSAPSEILPVSLVSVVLGG